MTFADGWICKACWKSNRPQDPVCYRCKTPRDADDAIIEAPRATAEARAERPEAVPDIVVALPVVIFRSYSRVWQRGGFGVLGLLILIAIGGVTDVGYLLLTAGLGGGLIISGILAGEVAEEMRNREVWAFIVGIVISVVAVISSVLAVNILAPDLFNPVAVRWVSVIVFGGAGLAAAAGLVLSLSATRFGGGVLLRSSGGRRKLDPEIALVARHRSDGERGDDHEGQYRAGEADPDREVRRDDHQRHHTCQHAPDHAHDEPDHAAGGRQAIDEVPKP